MAKVLERLVKLSGLDFFKAVVGRWIGLYDSEQCSKISRALCKHHVFSK